VTPDPTGSGVTMPPSGGLDGVASNILPQPESTMTRDKKVADRKAPYAAVGTINAAIVALAKAFPI
jgi:hypothetical protein